MQMIRSMAKIVGKRALPMVYEPLRQRHRRRVSADLVRITAGMVDRGLMEVMSGPFKGMKYTREATAAHYPPKLLGMYEAELHPVLEKIIASHYSTIVDVGCCEGYYAVGLAVRCPTARIHAFDIDENGRRWCAGLAEANGVGERVRVSGECTPEHLQLLGSERAFLLSDCEGFEIKLLDPERAPVLRGWDILVELHDSHGCHVTEVVLPRFAQTHDITEIWPAPRIMWRDKRLEFLSRRDRKIAFSDLRGEQGHWAFMRARNEY